MIFVRCYVIAYFGCVDGALDLVHVAEHMRPVLHVHAHLDHVEAQSDHVLGGRAVVARARVALERVVEVAHVEKVIGEVLLTASYAVLDRQRLGRLEVRVELFELERRLLGCRLHPVRVELKCLLLLVLTTRSLEHYIHCFIYRSNVYACL